MGSQGCVPQFFEDGFTEKKGKNIIKYLEAGWRLPTAMNQCNISRRYKQEVIRYLDGQGIKDYRK